MSGLEKKAASFVNASSEEARDEAFRELAFEIQQFALPIIQSGCWHDDDVESALQETLISVAQNIRALNDPLKLRAWVSQIARNTTHNLNRTRSRKFKSDFSIDEFEAAIERGFEVQNPPLTPDELARANDLKRVILALGKRCQELLTAALSGFTAREISEKTGELETSVASSLARCRKLAREALKQLEPHG